MLGFGVSGFAPADQCRDCAACVRADVKEFSEWPTNSSFFLSQTSASTLMQPAARASYSGTSRQ